MTLPSPITGAEEYLAAVYDRLGEILNRLPARHAAPEEQTPADGPKAVELREPAPVDEPAPEAEALKEPAPPARTTSARKRTTRKGGT